MQKPASFHLEDPSPLTHDQAQNSRFHETGVTSFGSIYVP